MTKRHGTLARIVDSHAFATVILAVIVANAVVLGLQTYDEIAARRGDLLDLLDNLLLAVFVVELVLRVASYGRHPGEFFRSGWNAFDFVVVAVAFVPGFQANSTLLRLARLARVIRIVRLLPDLRLLVTAVVRSLPPLFSMTVLTTLILFVYGMVGWTLSATRTRSAGASSATRC
jgi:voltage-gated sodium channel